MLAFDGMDGIVAGALLAFAIIVFQILGALVISLPALICARRDGKSKSAARVLGVAACVIGTAGLLIDVGSAIFLSEFNLSMETYVLMFAPPVFSVAAGIYAFRRSKYGLPS